MKLFFSLFLLFYAVNALGQIPFPKGFRLIKGENPTGTEDIYTNGRYTFQVHRTGWIEDTTNIKKTLSEAFGFQFRQTKDSLLWGTGVSEGFYSYIVYNQELIELYSRYNDSGFSYYSKWLLLTTRKYRNSHKLFFQFH